MRVQRVLAVLSMLAASGATVATLPAVSASASATGPVQSVTLALAPADPAGLAALAHASGGTKSQRAAALSKVVPSKAERDDVVASAHQLGLTVIGSTNWAVHARGPAGRILALFGSARGNSPHSHYGHNLPKLPPQFQGKVTAAFGGDETRPFAQHLALTDGTWVGSDFRSQYDVASVSSGSTSHQTIATVQLSGWSPGDLTTYAGSATPAPQYTGISDSFDPPTVDPNGEVEVDLDQESIYSIAPYAKQRAYLSGNDSGGEYDSLVAIGNDASDPTHDGYNITAASISWGTCEDASAAAAPTWDALEQALQYVVASGVTVFAASGDTGTTCDGTHVGVSYPASSPEVVGVGGTQLHDPTASAPTTEDAWSDSSGSSGGGTSVLFYQPGWQHAVDSGATMRTVPDISSLAGAPYFDAYTSSTAGGPGIVTLGGTSLASPSAAALFTDALREHGYSWGIGDVHAGLYANALDTSKLTDVGLTGYDQVTGLGTAKWDALVPALGGDEHLSMGTYYTHLLTVPFTIHSANFQSFSGYRVDLTPQCGAYGLSATKPTSYTFPSAPAHYWDGPEQLVALAVDGNNACHYSYGSVFIDTQVPTAHASMALTSPTSAAHVTLNLSTTDPAPSSGFSHYVVTIKNQANTTVYSNSNLTTNTVTIGSSQGSTYTATVTTRDNAGNSSPTATAKVTVPVDDKSFGYSATYWSTGSNSGAYGGSYHVSSHSTAYTTYTASARTYVLWVITSASGGKANVYINGTLVKTVDFYSSATKLRVPVTVYSSTTQASRQVKVVVLGQKDASSAGYNVYVDALEPRV